MEVLSSSLPYSTILTTEGSQCISTTLSLSKSFLSTPGVCIVDTSEDPGPGGGGTFSVSVISPSSSVPVDYQVLTNIVSFSLGSFRSHYPLYETHEPRDDGV